MLDTHDIVSVRQGITTHIGIVATDSSIQDWLSQALDRISDAWMFKAWEYIESIIANKAQLTADILAGILTSTESLWK